MARLMIYVSILFTLYPFIGTQDTQFGDNDRWNLLRAAITAHSLSAANTERVNKLRHVHKINNSSYNNSGTYITMPEKMQQQGIEQDKTRKDHVAKLQGLTRTNNIENVALEGPLV